MKLKEILGLLSLFAGILGGCNSAKPEILEYDGGELPLLERVESEAKVLDGINGKWVDYDDLVEDIQYIPLGDEKGVIGEIKHVLYFQGVYYIYDYKQDVVFLYDETGKCFKKISDSGSGPNEYFGIANIDIDPENKELIIGDGLACQVSFYDLQGTFKYKRKVKAQKEYTYWLKDSTFIHLMDPHQNVGNEELDGYALLEMKADSIVRKGFTYLPSQRGYCGGGKLIRGYNNALYYNPVFSDSLYRIESDSTYSLAYYAKFPNSIWEKHYQSEEFVNMINEREDRLFPWIYDTKDFLITNARIGQEEEKMLWMLYDKQKETTYIAKMKTYDSLTQLDRLWGFDSYGATEDRLIITLDGGWIEEHIKKPVKAGKMKITDPKLETVIKKMDSDSNPLLILTKFKSIKE